MYTKLTRRDLAKLGLITADRAESSRGAELDSGRRGAGGRAEMTLSSAQGVSPWKVVPYTPSQSEWVVLRSQPSIPTPPNCLVWTYPSFPSSRLRVFLFTIQMSRAWQLSQIQWALVCVLWRRTSISKHKADKASPLPVDTSGAWSWLSRHPLLLISECLFFLLFVFVPGTLYKIWSKMKAWQSSKGMCPWS